jgi:hexosaminidase
MSYVLVPVPRKSQFSEERLDFGRAEWVKVDAAFSSILKKHVAAFAGEVSRFFLAPLKVTAGSPEQGQIFLTVSLVSGRIKPQGYELTCRAEGVTLEAADEAGVFYGLQTLRQLIAQAGARLPGFTISDAPDFPRRGVMLDISRCKVPTMATLFQYVDLLASLKLNEFQLYIEHTFAFSAHEVVWHDSSPVTPEEILVLDAYCRERYVDLVPNLNSFGHFERWLRHPEYKHLAELPDGAESPWGRRWPYGSMLKPNEESLEFLDSLYDEFLPNFSSRVFNVGCDETWELGQGWSKPLCEEKGKTRVYLDFVLKIHELVVARDRQMMFWGDIILHEPELVKELPQDVTALEWGYDANHAFDERAGHFARSGVPFYVCPGTSSWNTLTGRTENCLGNLANAATNGIKHGAIGFLNTDWGDRGHHQYLPISYVGFLAGAAYSWCFESNEGVSVVDGLNSFVFQDKAGVLGELFFELGKVLELVPIRTPNSTIFNHLLFWDMDEKRGQERVEEIPGSAWEQCLRRFDELESRIPDARPGVVDGELLKAELENAIAMARHGVHRALAVKGKGMDRGALRRELQHVISRHEDLWLSRNRPGGLRENSDRLRKALEPLLE